MKTTDEMIKTLQKATSQVAGTLAEEYDFVYTNRPQERARITALLNEMCGNLVSLSESVACDNGALASLLPYFGGRYPALLSHTDFAVIFVDNMCEMQEIKAQDDRENGWSQNDYRGTAARGRALIDGKLRAEYEKEGEGFSLPVSVRKGDKLCMPCDLLGFCTALSGEALLSRYAAGEESEERNVVPQTRYPTIFLCVEALGALASSFRSCDEGVLYKKLVGERFRVGVSDFYFDYSTALKLTFAHEFSHLALGHRGGNVKNKMNRETQANFLASILLNDPIASIYILYKTCFQPAEYQRTLLFYNDFKTQNIGDAILKAFILQ